MWECGSIFNEVEEPVHSTIYGPIFNQDVEGITDGMDTRLQILSTDYGFGLFAAGHIGAAVPICWYTSASGDLVKPLPLSERMYAVACDYDGSRYVICIPLKDVFCYLCCFVNDDCLFTSAISLLLIHMPFALG